ncbi:hypothetical protein [Palleronia sp. LCG004]|uniref:hypothetical protein n=1 Tax=Palleronia sp. LCG004 TaxID=3079304 RepID=UPI0029429825|nr:hypothetical protein [Palleronia sp. LCG004]WOI57118.1 hypothetical protein RVY76_04830 [Palleronia sp. LCG004]
MPWRKLRADDLSRAEPVAGVTATNLSAASPFGCLPRHRSLTDRAIYHVGLDYPALLAQSLRNDRSSIMGNGASYSAALSGDTGLFSFWGPEWH